MNFDELLSLTLRIIDGGINGDEVKVKEYSLFLAEKLLAEGEIVYAQRVLDSILCKGSNIKPL